MNMDFEGYIYGEAGQAGWNRVRYVHALQFVVHGLFVMATRKMDTVFAQVDI